MWLPRAGNGGGGKQVGAKGIVAVAIEKDKGSQYAIKWTTDNLLSRGQTVVLIHVDRRSSSTAAPPYGNNGDINGATNHQISNQTKELFLSFHCFCTRKDIQCLDIVLEDVDVAKALTDYVSRSAIENLVLGASSRTGFLRRMRSSDVPSNVSKGAPDFCTVYVISKGKVSILRNSCRPVPFTSPLLSQIEDKPPPNDNNDAAASSPADDRRNRSFLVRGTEKTTPRPTPPMPRNSLEGPPDMMIKSVFGGGGRGLNTYLPGELAESDTDISFVSSGRSSTEYMSSVIYESLDSPQFQRPSTSSDNSLGSSVRGYKGNDLSSMHDFSISSFESGRSSSASHPDEVEAEMRRLKLELQKTMDLYSTACKEALTAKQKTLELERWRIEEEGRIEEARLAEEAASEIAEKENEKCRPAMETTGAAQRIAKLEAQRRIGAELEENQKASHTFAHHIFRYRRYAIEDIEEATSFFAESCKIGEGGYGPVYKCLLDHTPVAVKVLRPDAAQGKSQFQQEVEVLSCLRHPNMVLLLGACPEYGCLVYEYMARGSLEDRLFRRGNTPALSWQLRFKIAAEIATCLLFLHQTKPEPLVHRDLKPANILLDQNYVSKISDVGLARLVPPSVAEGVTQYRMTSTAGTFCYIDPEYQQTGMLGVKSDVYSFGIILLQLVTGKPAMGLTHYVGQSVKNGTFAEILDPAVPNWPVEEVLCFAKLGLGCAELRRKDRPDLGKIVLPELNRLRDLADEQISHFLLGGTLEASLNPSHASIPQEVLSDPHVVQYSG